MAGDREHVVDKKIRKNSSAKNSSIFSENDFPLLDAKPEVDRKCKKVRRHAGVALMQKKLADRGYILKNIVEDHGVGKVRFKTLRLNIVV